MKNLLLLVITFFSFQLINAQEQTSQLQDTIYDFKEVDIKPEYPGGVEAFYKFIAKNFKAPEEEGLNGKIITTFVIETDGSISDIKVLQDIGYGSGAEVFKVLAMSKKWIPAKLNDVAVRVLYQFPITIRSAKNIPKSQKINENPMKKILFLAISFFLIQTVSAQESELLMETELVTSPDVSNPRFNGGDLSKFYEFIDLEFNYSTVTKAGRIVVSFLVTELGEVKKIKVLEFPNVEAASEIIRVLNKSPKWEPAKRAGKPFSVAIKMPLVFKAKENSEATSKQ